MSNSDICASCPNNPKKKKYLVIMRDYDGRNDPFSLIVAESQLLVLKVLESNNSIVLMSEEDLNAVTDLTK